MFYKLYWYQEVKWESIERPRYLEWFWMLFKAEAQEGGYFKEIVNLRWYQKLKRVDNPTLYICLKNEGSSYSGIICLTSIFSSFKSRIDLCSETGEIQPVNIILNKIIYFKLPNQHRWKIYLNLGTRMCLPTAKH